MTPNNDRATMSPLRSGDVASAHEMGAPCPHHPILTRLFLRLSYFAILYSLLAISYSS